MNDARHHTLLIELGCEELPPKSLDRLAAAFFAGVCDRLDKSGIGFDRDASRPLFSPRRLAMTIAAVADRQPDREIERKGPALQAAFDEAGNPTAAAKGFAKSVGCEVSELETLKTEKGEWLYLRVQQAGKALDELLLPILQESLDALPVAKSMRWSDHDFSFVRPVQWLVILHGDRLIDGRLFGKQSARHSFGHRIHHPGPVVLDQAANYLEALEQARVLVDPAVRKQRIQDSVHKMGAESGGEARITDSLLAEVNNLVEWPVPVACSFEDEFLEVPQEALIASMEDHQKFFPVLDPNSGKLQSSFIAVANLDSRDFDAVRQGFERVIRPRLADAQFFWEQDRKQPLEASRTALERVVFQKSIGTVSDKSSRMAHLSKKIAEISGENEEQAARAALLCKCDLVSQMVGEFPELQGTMGGYYALDSGEPAAVAQAVSEHYQPRFSGDALPSSPLGQVVSLADRVDTLVGIFAAGLKPTGNKDPFALRRAALGSVRLLTETRLDLNLDQLLALGANAMAPFMTVSPDVLLDVRGFILDRARQYFRDNGADTRLVNAALAAPLSTLSDLKARIDALGAFIQRPEAEALVAANKRIGNILRKADVEFSSTIDPDRLVLAEEKDLFDEVSRLEASLPETFAAGDYSAALADLAGLHGAIDQFFEHVMVMVEDEALRDSRLALLERLKSLFDRVADLSRAG